MFSVTVQPPSLCRIPHSSIPLPKFALRLRASRIIIVPPQQASRSRIPNFSQGGSNLVHDPRRWRRTINSPRGGGDDGEEDDGDDDDEEEERSLDLLIRFLHNMFRKVSKRARKAVRSVLPHAISTKLVRFSVDGILMLAFLWVLKAFVEVLCTLGSVVFVSILLIRGVLSGITYLQESRNQKMNEYDEEFHAWNGAQPAI